MAYRPPSLSLRVRVCRPTTRTSVRLLGPCFKTGRLEPFRRHHDAQRFGRRVTSYITGEHNMLSTPAEARGLAGYLVLPKKEARRSPSRGLVQAGGRSQEHRPKRLPSRLPLLSLFPTQPKRC